MNKLKKSLNFYHGIAIIISILLGSGIFVVPAIVANICGIYSLLAWLLVIILVIPIAFIFAKLGSQYPCESGTAFFVKKAFGEKLGNLTSFLYLSVIPIAPPVAIITGANYLAASLNIFSSFIIYISILMIITMFVLNIYGLSFSCNVQIFITCFILLFLLIIIILGFLKLSSLSLTVNMSIISTIPKITKSMVIIFWCFIGIEAIVHLSSEFKDVGKDFFKAIFFGVLTVGFLYILLSFVVLKFNVFGKEQSNLNSLISLISLLVGNNSKWIVGIMGFLTCFSAVNLYILSCSRLIYSMSKNNKYRCLAHTSKKGVPIIALTISCCMIIATIVIKFLYNITLKQLISYSNGVFILIYLLASVSGIKLLKNKNRSIARPYPKRVLSNKSLIN